MWPRKSIIANPDSDQSISDDEEIDHDWPGNCLSLAVSAEKKEGSEILSRLELLRGTHEIETEISNSSRTKQTSSVFEDDVEIPNFYDEGDFIRPPKRVTSKDKMNNALSKISAPYGAKKFSKDITPGFGAEMQDNSYSWSSASKEAEALLHLNEHVSCHSKTKKSSKGVKDKGKPKLSFRFQSHREALSSPSTSKDENNFGIYEFPERLDGTELRTELPEDIQDEEKDLQETMPCEVEAFRHEGSEQSIAELLNGLQDTTNHLRGNSRKNKRGKRLHFVVKRNISPLGDRTVSRELSPDLMDSSKSSSDSEVSDKDSELAIPDVKRQTIVDQFQEAFGATFLNGNRTSLHAGPKLPRSGLFWKLQQVMQTEKERETDFMQKLGNGAHKSDEASCIYVKILSSHLDGKLTVCHCFVSENFESLPWSEPLKELENEESRKTIIFNPRVPIIVDLEVGNCVRIHPPWYGSRI